MTEVSTAFMDFFSYTICDTCPEQLVTQLKQNTFCGQAWSPYRIHGFEHGLKSACAVILWNVQHNPCIHIQMSGTACRAAEKCGIVHDWQLFLSDTIALGAKITRIDLAIDDYAGILTMEKIRKAASTRAVVSRMKSYSLQSDHNYSDGQVSDGCTFGSSKSDTRVRFYNKAMQIGSTDHWIRCELQLRDERAHAAALHLAIHGFAGSSGMIATCVDFRIPSAFIRRDRWKREEWWVEFLGCAERTKFGIAPHDESQARARENFFRLSRSFATLYEQEGTGFIIDLLQHGYRRIGRECPILLFDLYNIKR